MRRRRALVPLGVLLIAACTGGGTPPASTSPSAAATDLPTRSATSPTPTAAPSTTGKPTPGTRAWTQLQPAGEPPAAREDHTWTLDHGGLAWVFGGRDDATLHGDLWTYDLANDAWARAATGEGPSPAARFGHEAAWIPGEGLLIFGGQAGSTFFNDLWLFNPLVGRWAELPAQGDVPVARYGSCSGLGPDGRFWISHGFTENGTRFDDTKAFDPRTQAWTDETPAGEVPIKRCLHVCWWTADGRFVLYGGQTNGDPALGDLWSLAGDGSGGWQRLGEPGPLDRNMVAATRVGDDVLVVGGRNADRQAIDVAQVVDGATLGFAPLVVEGASPPARWGAALVYDEVRARVLLYGGTDGTATADLWALAWP